MKKELNNPLLKGRESQENATLVNETKEYMIIKELTANKDDIIKLEKYSTSIKRRENRITQDMVKYTQDLYEARELLKNSEVKGAWMTYVQEVLEISRHKVSYYTRVYELSQNTSIPIEEILKLPQSLTLKIIRLDDIEKQKKLLSIKETKSIDNALDELVSTNEVTETQIDLEPTSTLDSEKFFDTEIEEADIVTEDEEFIDSFKEQEKLVLVEKLKSTNKVAKKVQNISSKDYIELNKAIDLIDSILKKYN